MKSEDVKVGARVRYISKINQPHFFGTIGTIKKVEFDGVVQTFDVYQANGEPLGDCGPTWHTLRYFELVEGEGISTNFLSHKECPCGIFRGDCDYHK